MPGSLAWLMTLSAVAGAVVGGAGSASAGPRGLDYVVVDPGPPVFHAGPNVLYLDRCASGCAVTAGRDDAAAGQSSILGRDGVPSSVSLGAFRWGDAQWNEVVACMRQTYAPYDVQVVTERPATGPYVRVLVAGEASALNLAGNTLGVAPLTSNCSAQASAIAYAFANAHQVGADQATEICATAAHEAGHIFGLDHEFECKDPMTYLVGCGPKVFLNKTVACGEFDGPRACKCGPTQSSFRTLTSALGAGPAPAPPTLTLISPTDGDTVIPGFSVFVRSVGRPLSRAELWINGAQVTTLPGKTSDSPYELRTTAALADGLLRVTVRAYDDVGRLALLTAAVRKGADCNPDRPCPGGLTCAADGACQAAPGTIAVGGACSADAACASQLCAKRGVDQVCSQPCWPVASACDGELSCQHADDERLVCLPPAAEAGGCCSTGGTPASGLALTALVLGLTARRRRSPTG